MAMSPLLSEADIRAGLEDVWFVPILLQKSKIERHQKSRESRFLDASAAAMLCSADAKVRGRFCTKQ
jgi:hypothetical protein